MSEAEEREAFEAWMRDDTNLSLARHPNFPDLYQDRLVDDRWFVWQAARSQWRPIDSAPRDGTELLLVDADGVRVVGRWGKHNHVPMYGWIRQVELYGEEVDGFDAVAYQPLPPPPKGAQRARRSAEGT